MKISYLLPNCGVGGGPRVAYHQCNWLHSRGHDVRLYIIAKAPEWFKVDCPVEVCNSFEDAEARMSKRDGIKIATWYKTAPFVIRACRERGIPSYLVQDIETSYYPNNIEMHVQVFSTYRLPWKFIVTDSPWTERQLQQMGVTAPIHVIPPAIDPDIFKPYGEAIDRSRILYCGRSEALKGASLMAGAMRILREQRSSLHVLSFGIEPGFVVDLQAAYIEKPTDLQLARMYSSSGVYVSTSRHEGFNLPVLEAMACGCPVITTMADGNAHFCTNGWNCLIVEKDPADIANKITGLIGNLHLQADLVAGGLKTAKDYGLPKIGARLEEVLREYE